MKTKYTLFIVLLIFPLVILAQNPVEVARNYIERNRNSANLANVQQLEFQLSSDYKAPETNYHYVYFSQDINGIGIYNAIYNVVVDHKNNVVNSTHSFSNFTENAETVNLSNVISGNDALASAFKLADRPYDPQKIIMIGGVKHPDGILYKMRFVDTNKSNDTITVKLEWLPLEYVQEPSPIKKSLLLTWSVALEGKTNNNHWLMHFHAASGQLLQKQDLVTHCSFAKVLNIMPNTAYQF
jgi:extracellular elastinolytic metalloproteinase